jgi:hypothetical protein
MSPMQRERYPDHWPTMVTNAHFAAGFRCQGCGCRDLEDGTTSTKLTVHHPDRDTENPDARLTVLCAGCHLAVEGIARRRERVHASRLPGETLADAWRRARTGALPDQQTMEVTT